MKDRHCQAYIFPHLRCLPTDPSAQIRAHAAVAVFVLLNYRDQVLTLGHLAGFRKQRTLEQADERVPEPTEKTITVSSLAEGLGLVQGGIKIFEGTDSNVQQAVTTRQGDCEGEEETFVSPGFSV
jgi:hypothetical protein